MELVVIKTAYAVPQPNRITVWRVVENSMIGWLVVFILAGLPGVLIFCWREFPDYQSWSVSIVAVLAAITVLWEMPREWLRSRKNVVRQEIRRMCGEVIFPEKTATDAPSAVFDEGKGWRRHAAALEGEIEQLVESKNADIGIFKPSFAVLNHRVTAAHYEIVCFKIRVRVLNNNKEVLKFNRLYGANA